MTETKMITLLDDEGIQKMPLDMLDEALISAGFIRVNGIMGKLLDAFVKREKLKSRYPTFAPPLLLKVEVVHFPAERTYWAHKEMFDNWPDSAFRDELIEKGVIKDD